MPGSLKPPAPDRAREVHLLIPALYFLSGITALAYEVLWMRPIALLFGVGNLGAVITVAAFMAGLGVGSLCGARRRPCGMAEALRLFAFVEGGVALFALLLPLLLPLVDRQLSGISSLLIWQWLEGAVSFVLLMLPATALGFAFPMVLRAARAAGVSVALLYGVNALGGVLGALAPLILLPALGWRGALFAVVALGGCVAVVALWYSRRVHDGEEPRGVLRDVAVAPVAWRDFVAYAGVGAAALAVELGWVRMFGMVLLRTEYLLALVLALMLAGIGLGSLLARWRRFEDWFPFLPWLAAGGVLVSLAVWPQVGQWAGRALFNSLMQALAEQALVLVLIVLPTTLVLGAWLPLLARRLGGDDAHSTAATLYGVNSLGAACGALVAGLLLTPVVGTPATMLLAAALLLLSAARWSGIGRWGLLVPPLFLALAAPWWRMPAASALSPAVAGSVDLDRYEDAVNVTHVLRRPDGQRLLLADLQRMDAATDPTSVAVQKNQARLPLLFHPDARSVLFLGLGTGITAAGSLPWSELDRTAVELSPGAIRAAADWFRPVNGGVVDHMRVVHDDVRRFLRRDDTRYDIIVGDLFHPDMAGRGALLSQEQFARVRRHLAPGGLFVQWIALNQFDTANLAVLFSSFHRVFPEGLFFIDGYRLALLARPEGRLTLPAAVPAGGDGGEGVMSWAARLWGRVPDSGGAAQSEWWPVIEYTLPRLRYRASTALLENWRWLLRYRLDDMTAARLLRVGDAQRESFRRARQAALANVRGWMAQLRGDDAAANRFVRDAYRWNPRNRWASFAVADRLMESIRRDRLPPGISRREALRQLLKIRPDHLPALRMMVALSADDPGAQAAWRRRLRRVAPLARLE